jgi:hypothetical protein
MDKDNLERDFVDFIQKYLHILSVGLGNLKTFAHSFVEQTFSHYFTASGFLR